MDLNEKLNFWGKNVSRTVTKTYKVATEKSGKLIEEAKLRMQIASENDKISEKLEKIGMVCLPIPIFCVIQSSIRCRLSSESIRTSRFAPAFSANGSRSQSRCSPPRRNPPATISSSMFPD